MTEELENQAQDEQNNEQNCTPEAEEQSLDEAKDWETPCRVEADESVELDTEEEADEEVEAENAEDAGVSEEEIAQTAEEDESEEAAENAEESESEQVTEVAETAAEEDEEAIDIAEIEVEVNVTSVIEAVLFASDEALTANHLAKISETSVKQVREAVKELNAKYAANNNAFVIEKIAGGYQMMTLPAFNNWLKKLLRTRDDTKLSPAALETLAIISYKQPIIRADVENIRGVAAGEMIRGLMHKGLVKIVGRAEVLGRPLLYGTTKKFLDAFGLNSLKELPSIEELKKPAS